MTAARVGPRRQWLRFRPEAPIALLFLLGILALALLVNQRLLQVDENLPLEVLAEQRDGGQLAGELERLKAAAETARRVPGTAAITEFRGLLESLGREIRPAGGSPGSAHLPGIAAMHGLVKSLLADLERQTRSELAEESPSPASVLERADLRLADARRELRDLAMQADGQALALLEQQSGQVSRLRVGLLVILFCMGLLSLVLAVFVIRERLAHRRAEETRGQLREAIESLPGGFALFDRDERLVLCNSAYAQVFPGLDHELRPGIAFERLLRKAVQADCIDDEGFGPEKWVSERLAAFRFPTRAIETRTRDGRCHRIAERRTVDGGVVAIATDITALRRRETELERLGAELQQKNRILDVALGNMAQGLAMFDGEQRLVVANQRFLELLDLPPELGRPGVELAEVVRISAERRRSPASDIEELVRHRLEMARHRGELWHREVHVDGRVIEVFHRPIASGGSVATYDDVSDEHYAELQLLEAKERAEIANRAKSEFLANVSHELRTPLNAIIGFSDIIARELFGPTGNDSYRAYAKDIHDSGSQLLATINDILDLSTLETGKLVLRDRHLDLAKAVQTAAGTLEEQARQAEVSVDIWIPPSLPLLRFDHRSLQQIVGNLLANAIKFSHPGGRVEVSASYREDKGIVLAIADQGPGIAPEHLETAMAPFGQVQHPLVREHGGTGLGLPLSRHLVNLHDGELTIESRLGEGTTVLVQFPPARITPRGRQSRVSETG